MKRRMFLAAALILLPATLGGCASGGGGAGSERDMDLLTQEDLMPYLSQDAYQAIRRLRGSWLSGRGAMGSARAPSDPNELGVMRADDGGEGQVQVYIDGVRTMNGIEDLKELATEVILEVKYMNPRDATMMYGTDHGSGAILITTKR